LAAKPQAILSLSFHGAPKSQLTACVSRRWLKLKEFIQASSTRREQNRYRSPLCSQWMDGQRMRRDRLKHASRHARGIFAADVIRALIAGGGLAAVLLLVFFIGVRTHYFKLAASGPAVANVPPEVQTRKEELAHRLGSILFVPVASETCKERQFDNFTGSIVSETSVNCEQRLAEQKFDTPAVPHDNTTRMRAILETFNNMKNR
jgi:hypothetical protein